MYERYYGLTERPFDLTPNPRYLFLTPKHREALSHLQYGVSGSRGITLLTGDAGTGKTTLVHTALEQLSSALESAPTTPVRRLDVLPPAERQQVLVEWNQTEVEHPRDRCIHQLFEEQVERTPEAVAVVGGDVLLIYRELNARANQFARYLQKLGVGPEVSVCLCVERSLVMIVGLLGILKAGGAYVPLDPCFPAERQSLKRGRSSIGRSPSSVPTCFSPANSLPRNLARLRITGIRSRHTPAFISHTTVARSHTRRMTS